MQYDELSGWVELWVIMDVLILEMKSIANIFHPFLALVLSSTSWVVGMRGASKTYCIFCETWALVLVGEHG